jgi:hypothetical protein
VAKAGREPRGAGESGGRGRWMVPQGEGAGVSPTGRGMCSFFAGSSARVCSVRFLEWKIVFGSDFLALWSRRLGTITSEIQIKNCLSVKSKNQKKSRWAGPRNSRTLDPSLEERHAHRTRRGWKEEEEGYLSRREA